MKKRLLSALASLLIGTALMTAQTTTTWNFSDTSAWPISGGYPSTTVVNNLGFLTGTTTTTGAVEANNATFDGISFTQRMKLNGGSYVSGTTDFSMPTQRALFFDVTGASTIKIWYKNGGGNTRTLYVTNGTSVINSFPYTDSSVGQVVTVNYTGSASRIYIGADQAINFYQITATNVGTTATLAVSNPTKDAAKIYSSGNQVFVSKITDNTKIDVYTMHGALVKTLNAKADISFDLKPGIYLVNASSAKGTKSQKVSVK